MLDETEEAPDSEASDDAVDVADVSDAGGDDAGGDDAVDLADLGGEVQTADEPAVTAEELMDIPDAPEVPGADQLTEARANEAMDQGAQAAQEDSSGGDPAPADDAAADDDA